jgi:gas vesicle protein
MLAGGLIGMIAAIAVAPQLKPDTRKRILETSKDWSGRAGKVWHRGREAARDAADNLR